MDIKIVDKESPSFELTREDVDYIKSFFYYFNLDASDTQALSVINESLYYDIKQWGIDDTPTRESLSEEVMKFITNGYKSSFQTSYEKGETSNHILYKKEIHYEGIQKGLSIYKEEDLQKYTFTPQELESYLVEKNKPKPSHGNAGLFFYGGMGSGKSVFEKSLNNVKEDDIEEK